MILDRLSIINFKNYDEAQIQFCSKFNCFVGNNGMGKTNLLDAIYYVSFCKSFFNSSDSQNIKHDLPFFAIQAWINKNGETHEIYCGVKRGHKKQFKHNKKEYERLSEHIGLYPLVMISPSDIDLIWDGSEIRRKFMDSIISQYDKVYLEKLIAYNHVLLQRNTLLKQFHESRSFDSLALEIWDDQLIIYGEDIIKARMQFLHEFIPLFTKNYQFISGSDESVSLDYEASVKDKSYKAALLTSLDRDRVVHYTTVGPHKDDLDFKLMGNSLKKFASQGQQKSYVLALKLAQFEFIKEKKQTKPLLLLDDIYDKLDETRFKKLIELVSGDNFGQIFITDTHPQRIKTLFEHNHSEYIIYMVNNGAIENMAKNNNLIKLGDAISQIFKEEKLDEKYSIFAIRNGWEGIVGKTVAKHTTQINFLNGLLYVSIDSSVIRNEIAYAKEDIIKKVNHFVGKRLIKELILK